MGACWGLSTHAETAPIYRAQVSFKRVDPGWADSGWRAPRTAAEGRLLARRPVFAVSGLSLGLGSPGSGRRAGYIAAAMTIRTGVLPALTLMAELLVATAGTHRAPTPRLEPKAVLVAFNGLNGAMVLTGH